MCLFITAVVPRSAPAEELRRVADEHRFAFTECENPHVLAQLRPSERYVHATRRGCDCGSPLFARDGARSAEDVAREVERLRRKRWSEAKIARWLQSTGPRPIDPNAAPSGPRSIDDWARFLEAALLLPGVPCLGILGHWYRGAVEREEVTIARRVTHDVAELRSGQRGQLEEDVVHEFRNGGVRSG